MNQGTISVIIPVYNVQPYLRRCLDSVLGNTYSKLEIICVDDGSSDQSLSILKEYSQRDNRIHVYSKENRGVTSARNYGLDKAHGEWVSFVDSDDWLHSQYFEILVEAWRMNGCAADIVVCHSYKTDSYRDDIQYAGLSREQVLPYGWREVVECVYLATMVWGRIYKRELLEGFRLPEEYVYGEDTALNLMAMGKLGKFSGVLVPLPLYYYYQRESSSVHTTNISKRISALSFITDRLKEFPSAEAQQAISEMAINCLSYVLLMKNSYPHALYVQGRKKQYEALLAWKSSGIRTNGRFLAYVKSWLWYALPSFQRWYCGLRNPMLKSYIRAEINKNKIN